MAIYDYPEFAYHVITLLPDGHKVDERLVLAVNYLAASAAFDAMVAERKGRAVLLVQRGRIIRDSREPDSPR